MRITAQLFDGPLALAIVLARLIIVVVDNMMPARDAASGTRLPRRAKRDG